MAIKPSEVPLMNEERQTALREAVAQIDEKILQNAGQDPQKIGLEYLGKTSGSYRHWFYEKLVEEYRDAGWKYVTVYMVYSRGSHSQWEPYLFLSQKAGLVTEEAGPTDYKTTRYLAGHKMPERDTDVSSRSGFFSWLISKRT